jgi:hypothetical protein
MLPFFLFDYRLSVVVALVRTRILVTQKNIDQKWGWKSGLALFATRFDGAESAEQVVLVQDLELFETHLAQQIELED